MEVSKASRKLAAIAARETMPGDEPTPAAAAAAAAADRLGAGGELGADSLQCEGAEGDAGPSQRSHSKCAESSRSVPHGSDCSRRSSNASETASEKQVLSEIIGQMNLTGLVDYDPPDQHVFLPDPPSRSAEPIRPGLGPDNFLKELNPDDYTSEHRKLLRSLYVTLAAWKKWGNWAEGELSKGVDACQKHRVLYEKLEDKHRRLEKRMMNWFRVLHPPMRELIGEQTMLLCKASVDAALASARWKNEIEALLQAARTSCTEFLVSIADHGDLKTEQLKQALQDATLLYAHLCDSGQRFSALCGQREAEESSMRLELQVVVLKERLHVALLRQNDLKAQAEDLARGKGYHECMRLMATVVQRPDYGISLEFDSGRSNPDHPYWRGWSFAKLLKQLDLLDDRESEWYRADVDREHPLSLLHPVAGVKQRLGYFSGLSDQLKNPPIVAPELRLLKPPDTQAPGC